MAKNSGIRWTDHTWNTVTGCTRISKGCMNCYAETLSPLLQARYRGMAEKTAVRWSSAKKLSQLPMHVQQNIAKLGEQP